MTYKTWGQCIVHIPHCVYKGNPTLHPMHIQCIYVFVCTCMSLYESRDYKVNLQTLKACVNLCSFESEIICMISLQKVETKCIKLKIKLHA